MVGLRREATAPSGWQGWRRKCGEYAPLGSRERGPNHAITKRHSRKAQARDRIHTDGRKDKADCEADRDDPAEPTCSFGTRGGHGQRRFQRFPLLHSGLTLGATLRSRNLRVAKSGWELRRHLGAQGSVRAARGVGRSDDAQRPHRPRARQPLGLTWRSRTGERLSTSAVGRARWRPARVSRSEGRLNNETHVHPRTREIIVTERGAFSRPARAVENWAPAAAERTVKRARRAFGGWNASYTVVEPRLFGEQRPLASQRAATP